jgi:acyl carrier protein
MNDRLAIRGYLQKLLRQKGDPGGFTDSDSLIVTGRLESVDTLEVVVFLEEQFQIDFADRGFDQNDLDSVDSIMSLVESR